MRVFSVDFCRFLAQFAGIGGGEEFACWIGTAGCGLRAWWTKGEKEIGSRGSKGQLPGASTMVVSLSLLPGEFETSVAIGIFCSLAAVEEDETGIAVVEEGRSTNAEEAKESVEIEGRVQGKLIEDNLLDVKEERGERGSRGGKFGEVMGRSEEGKPKSGGMGGRGGSRKGFPAMVMVVRLQGNKSLHGKRDARERREEREEREERKEFFLDCVNRDSNITRGNVLNGLNSEISEEVKLLCSMRLSRMKDCSTNPT